MVSVPVDFASLVLQGGALKQLPAVSTQVLSQHLCSASQDLARWVCPDMGHTSALAPSNADMVHRIADRFTKVPSPDPCHPAGVPGAQTTSCT